MSVFFDKPTPEQEAWDGIYKIPTQRFDDPKISPMEIVNKMYENLGYKSPTDNPVEHPDHYNNGAIECIDYLKDNMSWQGYTGYLEGNCKKYLHRWRYKQKPVEDLKKARWYLDRLIKELETEGTD